MPAVDSRPDPTGLKPLLASWLAAACVLPATMIIAAVGQAVATMVAGGGWIGICLPMDRQVWALVNQPVINFAASWSSTGYWLGTWALPLAIAVAAMPLSLRLKDLSSQLFVIQAAWGLLVMGAGWHTFLDPTGGHIARWLTFHGLPSELQWLAEVAVIAAAPPVVLRLLAIARIRRFHITRSARLATVALHLIPAPLAWAVAVSAFMGEPPVQACIAAALPLLAALVTAWVGYPAPPTHAIGPLRPRVLFAVVLAALIAWGVVVVAGRPLPGNRRAALQWAEGGATNNIRDWMEPWRAPWLDSDRNGVR